MLAIGTPCGLTPLIIMWRTFDGKCPFMSNVNILCNRISVKTKFVWKHSFDVQNKWLWNKLMKRIKNFLQIKMTCWEFMSNLSNIVCLFSLFLFCPEFQQIFHLSAVSFPEGVDFKSFFILGKALQFAMCFVKVIQCVTLN